MGQKKRPLFRSRQLPLADLDNVPAKEPVQSLSAPMNQMFQQRQTKQKGVSRPRRTKRGSESDLDRQNPTTTSSSHLQPRLTSTEQNAAGQQVASSLGAVRDTSGKLDVRAIRKARAGAAQDSGVRRRPARQQHHNRERMSRSAESNLGGEPLTHFEKENVEAAAAAASQSGLSQPGGVYTKRDLYYQLPSSGGGLGYSRSKPKEPFIGAPKFAGPKEGYVYSNGKFGVGYYLDQLPKLQGKMCAHAMFDVLMTECMKSVKRLSIIKARRVVNALVDSSVEISHYRSQMHWYENKGEERNETLRENLAFAAKHDQGRWESWDVLVHEILRLRESTAGQTVEYLNSEHLKNNFAKTYSKREEDISAIQELLEESSRSASSPITMESSASVLAKFKITPRTMKGLHIALNAAKEAKGSVEGGGGTPVSICNSCTNLRGRRLCSQCLRKKAKDDVEMPSARVRHNSYGSLLYKDLTWWESKRHLGNLKSHAQNYGGLDGDYHEALLDMVYRLQYKACKRQFSAWKMHVYSKRSTRAKERLTNAHMVTSVFHRWKKLLIFRKAKKEELKGQNNETSSSSSPSSEHKKPSSSQYVQESFRSASNIKATGDMIKGM